ncbi:MAG: DUF2179 domain-containing protein [Candidatus Latescibacteria bacterium]|nr:DUF2179 domain-containing protein [Candidatus Latescibacterota bacterium]NIO57277.1 DUF2179 domain-containing protein [Candidatus Latescibacterota bacterium]
MMNEVTSQVILFAILIFVARVADVTLGTMRIAFISRGQRFIAPIIGFFEMLIWLLAIRQIITNLTNVAYYFSYAGGFAAGIFVGLYIEEKMAIGSRIIRVITKKDATDLIQSLSETGYGVTSIDAKGNEGPVHLIFSVIKRHDLPDYIRMIQKNNPKAFYSIEDVRFVSEGVFPARESFIGRSKLSLYRMFAKFR